jgi:hypothetical protein
VLLPAPQFRRRFARAHEPTIRQRKERGDENDYRRYEMIQAALMRSLVGERRSQLRVVQQRKSCGRHIYARPQSGERAKRYDIIEQLCTHAEAARHLR